MNLFDEEDKDVLANAVYGCDSKNETRAETKTQRRRNNQPVGHAAIHLDSEGPEGG